MDLLKIKNKYSLIICIGLILIIISITTFIDDYTKHKKISQIEQFQIEEFLNVDDSLKNNAVNQQTINDNEVQKKKITYRYIAVLEIPTINLKKGLVDPNSKYNNVKYNIEIIPTSTLPNIINGNLILAGHNGANYISYFKNLSKMNIGDSILVYYNGYKYQYTLSEIYDVDKTGIIKIYRDFNKTTITLVTCKKNTKDKQVIYIGYLNDILKY